MSKSFYHKISDRQWKIICRKQKPQVVRLTVLDAIFWILDSGAKDKLSDCFLNFVMFAAVMIQI